MHASMIRVLEHEPGRGLPERAEDWLRELGRPTLLCMPGRDRTRTRAVTTLLHGDEPSGTRAVHAWLRSGVEPATDALFYIGSIDAALAGRAFAYRMLPGTRDANRCFLPPFEGEQGARSLELIERLQAAAPEALVDLHNNSGRSPPYAVGTRADTPHLALTALFADHFVCNDLRLGTLNDAADHFTTAIVVECGRAFDPVADAVALAGLERFLCADPLPVEPGRATAVDVLEHPLRFKVDSNVQLAFGDAPLPGAAVTVCSDVDRHNLDALPGGTLFGWLGDPSSWPFDARGADGVEVSRELLACEGGVLRTRRSFIPAMMTTSPEAAKNDCLFYALERRTGSAF
jgi:hypothetical protein